MQNEDLKIYSYGLCRLRTVQIGWCLQSFERLQGLYLNSTEKIKEREESFNFVTKDEKYCLMNLMEQIKLDISKILTMKKYNQWG